MSNTIAVVIALMGIVALFAAAGAVLIALRKSGSHPAPLRSANGAGEITVSPELAAEAERRMAEADLVAEQVQRQLDEASRTADQVRASAESDASAIVRRAEESAEKVVRAQQAAEEQIQATK